MLSSNPPQRALDLYIEATCKTVSNKFEQTAKQHSKEEANNCASLDTLKEPNKIQILFDDILLLRYELAKSQFM